MAIKGSFIEFIFPGRPEPILTMEVKNPKPQTASRVPQVKPNGSPEKADFCLKAEATADVRPTHLGC